MSTVDIDIQNTTDAHDHHDDHHHTENFFTKYVFSLDHKTIAKQFLITGLLWAFNWKEKANANKPTISCNPSLFMIKLVLLVIITNSNNE